MLTPPLHVRVANVDGDLVFFDLADDRYTAIAREVAEGNRAAFEGTSTVQHDEVLTELLRDGLLVPASIAPRGSNPPERTHPSECPAPRDTNFRVAEFLGLLSALAKSLMLLRKYRPVAWEETLPCVTSKSGLSDQALFDLVARFRTMRCVLPWTGRCLIQSMMLTIYLRRRSIACDWIFGVRTHPFAAHCWVETRNCVLNDSAEHVRWYRPIARF